MIRNIDINEEQKYTKTKKEKKATKISFTSLPPHKILQNDEFVALFATQFRVERFPS